MQQKAPSQVLPWGLSAFFSRSWMSGEQMSRLESSPNTVHFFCSAEMTAASCRNAHSVPGMIWERQWWVNWLIGLKEGREESKRRTTWEKGWCVHHTRHPPAATSPCLTCILQVCPYSHREWYPIGFRRASPPAHLCSCRLLLSS